MSIDSFGHDVMSLRELIAELQAAADADPKQLDRPVWVDNCPPLYWPVKAVRVPADPTRGLGIFVERGGN